MTDYTKSQPKRFENQNGSETPKKQLSVEGQIVNCRNVNVRSAPTKNGDILQVLPVGADVTIHKDTHKGWLIISTDILAKGYIMSDFVKEK